MSLYLDTSVLIAACSAEPASERVRDWLVSNTAQNLTISAWVETEFAAALAMKVRGKVYTLDQGASVNRIWDALRTTQVQVLEIGPEHFTRGATFAGRPELNLRAGDALHLAICDVANASIVTLDKTMAAAARALDIETIAP